MQHRYLGYLTILCKDELVLLKDKCEAGNSGNGCQAVHPNEKLNISYSGAIENCV